MKTLVSAVAAALVSLHAVDPAYAGAPDWWLIGIHLRHWIGLIVLLLILNLLCCWWRRR